MAEWVRTKQPDGSVTVAKTTDAMLEEIGRLAHGWQNERDYIRTICEVHMRWANDDAAAALMAIIGIVKGVR